MQDFPKIVDPFLPAAKSTAPSEPSPASAPEAQSTHCDAWDYLIDSIDDFATAKCIADHFDAHPQDLHRPEVEIDAFALYLRAKLTLKRQAIAYAESKATVEKARLQSRSVRNVFQRFAKHWLEVGRYLFVNPQGISTVALAAVLYYVCAH